VVRLRSRPRPSRSERSTFPLGVDTNEKGEPTALSFPQIESVSELEGEPETELHLPRIVALRVQFGHSLHQNAAVERKIVTNPPLKCCCTLYLQTEEWVSG
jgi:hypothetical protein